MTSNWLSKIIHIQKQFRVTTINMFIFCKQKLLGRSGLSVRLRSSFFSLRIHINREKGSQRNIQLCLRHTYPNWFDAVPESHNVLADVYSAIIKIIRCSACGVKGMMSLFWDPAY